MKRLGTGTGAVICFVIAGAASFFGGITVAKIAFSCAFVTSLFLSVFSLGD